MKEKPILFSGEMINAVLSDYKTVTRRVVNPVCNELPIISFNRWGIEHFSTCPTDWQYNTAGNPLWISTETDGTTREWSCPYGEPESKLWVRESMKIDERGVWHYSADNAIVYCKPEYESDMVIWAHHKETEHCPSIHMPRWASRITLEVTDVRVERIQSISEKDCERELGVKPYSLGSNAYGEFHRLWDKINAKRGYGWEQNPWVWVVNFKRPM